MSYAETFVHYVFTTHNRTPWIESRLERFLYPVLSHEIDNLGAKTFAIGGIEDQVHVAVSQGLSHRPEDVARELKRRSTAAIRHQFREFRGFRWQATYAAFSVGHGQMPQLIDYIQNQKLHHARETLDADIEPLARSRTQWAHRL